MPNPPALFDRDIWCQNRERARRIGFADFLHLEAKAEILEKLIDVNRSFRDAAIVTAHPEIWADIMPDAKLVAVDDVLDLEPCAHDLVIHAMSLHWSNDPLGQIIQAKRALRPDGLFLAVLFGGQTLNELRVALAQAEIAVMSGLSPRVAPMAEIRDLGALLQRAGFALPVADSFRQSVSYGSFFKLLYDLRAMGEANAMYDRHKNFSRRALFDQAQSHYVENFSDDEGRLKASYELVFLSGWAPSDTQPKPLQPGSAQTRLADALGTKELGASDPPVLGSKD